MERGSATITIKIEKIIKFNKEYLVYFTEDIVLSLIEDEIILYNLYKGKTISKEELLEIDEKHIFYKYYFLLKKKILIKPLSIKEVKCYLEKEHLEDSLINEIINKLLLEDYLNDYRLGLLLKEECYYKLRSKYYYQELLKNKGIEYNIYKELLDLYKEEEILKNLISYFQTFQKALISLPIKLQSSKISQKMARNGFLEDTIKKVLENIKFE